MTLRRRWHLLNACQMREGFVRYDARRLGGGVRSETDGPVNGVRGHIKNSGPSAKPADPGTPPGGEGTRAQKA
ncbi:MAG: hypothetical protein WCJ09_21270 [Planctomycetota bacterium]